MKSFLLVIALCLFQYLFAQPGHRSGNSTPRQSQLTCNNWLNLPAIGSYVRVGDLDVSGSNITVEATFNRNAAYLGSDLYAGNIVSKHTGPADINYLLRPNSAEITTSTGYHIAASPCPFDLNKTYHVALVYNGSTLKFYRNGHLMAQVAVSGTLYQNDLITTIGEKAIGPPNPPEALLGYINEVRIWNTARTQAELKAYRNTSLPNPTSQAGLLAYYTFDNLQNKQGNAAWNGAAIGNIAINATNPSCSSYNPADSCGSVVVDSYDIINSYTPVTGINGCENRVIVEDASSFKIGDTVLLMQMKGATIDSTNTGNFGSIISYGNAGNYEFNYISQINGNTVAFRNEITRQYTIPQGKVQLIRVPYYASVSTSSVLTCLPWDGQKGGVLAFNVKDTLTLNANIDVTGKGFRGGHSINSQSLLSCNTVDYYYPISAVNAAAKGESIYLSGNAIASGRGAAANGGGGGNGHNSGGAGGGNGGTGGVGGYQLDQCGSIPFVNGGVGGKALTTSSTINKVFLGGGGGAGHSDNILGMDTDGSSGGGIVIINSGAVRYNNYQILAKGADIVNCNNATTNCHNGSGGGGGGGSVLIECNNHINAGKINVGGGKGGNIVVYSSIEGRIGPGGGGGAGVIGYSNSLLSTFITETKTGGINGVIIPNNSNPWGASAGQSGSSFFNLKLAYDTTLFRKNIDSVRIKDSLTGCSTVEFKGVAYTRIYPVANWQWSSGNGATATTQNATFSYVTPGTYTVKLIVTDVNGCKDSVLKSVTITGSTDFAFKVDPCNPLSVQFAGSMAIASAYWSFGDGTTNNGLQNPLHTFPAAGAYSVKFVSGTSSCWDTASKIIFVGTQFSDRIITRDTTICSGNTLQLLTKTASAFCWFPVDYLNNPFVANPVTSTPLPATYFFTSLVADFNLVANADFNAGNNGFSSQYAYTTSGGATGSYTVGNNVTVFNTAFTACNADHTTGTGQMLMANTDHISSKPIWTQTIIVQPNTSYEFSFWMQSLQSGNPAKLRFNINGVDLSDTIVAAGTTCNWQRYSMLWNSGNLLNAQLSIKTISTLPGSSFALDDISFAVASLRRDSVSILVDTPQVIAFKDTSICSGTTVQLAATGAQVYSWAPAGGLSAPNLPNPLAAPTTSTQYIVTGTTINGCIARDTVMLTLKPKPFISNLTSDFTICNRDTTRLSASGGIVYQWTPTNGLSNNAVANPLAYPAATTLYKLTITDSNNCQAIDSVKITVRPRPVFAVTPPRSICSNDSVHIQATGGDYYHWSPAVGLSASNIANPVATPVVSTNYFVHVRDAVCNDSANLSVLITVNALPQVVASSSGSIDCSNRNTQLIAAGASLYHWQPGAYLNDSTISNPVAVPSQTTIYTVTGTDRNGCSAIDTVLVEVKFNGKAMHYVPTAFTPNGDGLNDCFNIRSWGTVSELQFAVFDRWGKRVFYTTDISACWDGTYNGNPVHAGNFVYIIHAKTACGTADVQGSVLLLR